MENKNFQPQTQQPQQMTLKQKQNSVANLLNNYKTSIAQALPKHLTPDRLMRVFLTASVKNPALLDCTQHSLISSILTIGQLGLMPDDVLGECYLIPFNNTKKGVKECQIMIGYKGLCSLAMRSGQVKSVQARAVFAANAEFPNGAKGDFFEFEMGLDEKLKHVPNGIKDPAFITHFYAVVKFNNGGHVLNVMTKQEVEAIRNESANYKFAKYKESTIWGKYFEEMGCKTVLRRLMKYVPLSPEIQQAIGTDEAGDYGKQNLGVDLMADPNTPEEVSEAIEAEIYTEIESEEIEKMQSYEEAKQDKVKAAEDNLEQVLAKRKRKLDE